MFRAASLLLLNKCDLLPHLDFDLAFALDCARRVNPRVEVLQSRRRAASACPSGSTGSTGSAAAASAPGSLVNAARHIRVGGVVQGVGFRPFVWRLAHDLQLSGWVRNDSRGWRSPPKARCRGLRR